MKRRNLLAALGALLLTPFAVKAQREAYAAPGLDDRDYEADYWEAQWHIGELERERR